MGQYYRPVEAGTPDKLARDDSFEKIANFIALLKTYKKIVKYAYF